jgi:hypothetical protein
MAEAIRKMEGKRAARSGQTDVGEARGKDTCNQFDENSWPIKFALPGYHPKISRIRAGKWMR